MAALTFLDTLRIEVARMQAAKPEKLGEIARANALIMQGQVVPCAEDPQTALVLSSDGKTQYSVNGVCSCTAGQHDKPCKHLAAWRLYRYVERQMAAQPTPEALGFETKHVPLPEAPASINVRVMIGGREVLWTLRDADESRLATRLEALLARYPVPAPANPQAPTQGQDWCQKHTVLMRWNEGKNNRTGWYSHRTDDGWCQGR